MKLFILVNINRNQVNKMIIDTRKKYKNRNKQNKPSNFKTDLNWKKIDNHEYVDTTFKFKIERFRRASDFSTAWRLIDIKYHNIYVSNSLWEAQQKADNILTKTERELRKNKKDQINSEIKSE